MLNPMDLTGRTVLVTGASSGIGRETAILLDGLAAKVVLVARHEGRLADVRARLEHPECAVEPFDLARFEEIPGWLKAVAGRHGPFDGLVHCAGTQITAPLKVLDAAPVESLWRVNTSAALWLAKGFRQRGVNRQGGSIVLLSSVLGMVGLPGLSAYSASKGAIVGMTRSLAMELARENILVNCVVPGVVRTEMVDGLSGQLSAEDLARIEKDYPLGFGRPIDVANVIAFLLAPSTRWITGTAVVVDGGYTCH